MVELKGKVKINKFYAQVIFDCLLSQ